MSTKRNPHESADEHSRTMYQRRDSLAIRFFVSSIVVLALAIGSVVWVASENATEAKDEAVQTARIAQQISDALVDNCQRNSNTLLRGLQQYFQTELAQQRKLGYKSYHAFFPDIPPHRLQQLLKAEKARLHYDIHNRFRELDCAALFSR